MTRIPVLDLFAGYGGFSLAFETITNSHGAGVFETMAFAEIDPYASAILAERFPGSPNLGDIRHVSRDSILARCDRLPLVITGGFPCQPHSVAGKQLAGDDDRDLWPECRRMLRELRPRFAVFENVPGLRHSKGYAQNGELIAGLFFNAILSDLAELSYACIVATVSAADIGAPHRRDRIWILCADQQPDARGLASGVRGQRRDVRRHESVDTQLADGSSGGRGKRWEATQPQRSGHIDRSGSRVADTGRNGGGENESRGRSEIGTTARRIGEVSRGEQTRERMADADGSGGDEDWNSSELRANRVVESFGDRGRADANEGREVSFWPAARGLWPARPGQPQHEWEPPRIVADPSRARLEGHPGHESAKREPGRDTERQNGQARGSRVPECDATGELAHPGVTSEDARAEGVRARNHTTSEPDGREAQSLMGGDVDGAADWVDSASVQVCEAKTGDTVNRVHRLKALGNGIVPGVAMAFAGAIFDQLVRDGLADA